jgi:lysophospholipase L1-like esterase
MMEEAEAAGAHLVVVDVPMPSSYRDEVTSSPQGRRYAAWLRRELEARGATYVELTSIADDATFEDGVHLNTEGARTFSRALADAVAPLLTPTPSARAPTQAR